MSGITKLSCELVASILRSFDDISFLPPTLLTCRQFYAAFKEYPNILIEIMRQQVTSDLLPYSVAVVEASRLPHPRTSVGIQTLLDTLYDDPAQLVARLQMMTLSDMLRMGRTHDVIHDLATDFAADAWDLLSHGDSGVSGKLVLSPKEYFRFCRAFYRVELFCTLFRGEGIARPTAVDKSEIRGYLSRHPPWENEQICCVHDFLEKRLSTGRPQSLWMAISLTHMQPPWMLSLMTFSLENIGSTISLSAAKTNGSNSGYAPLYDCNVQDLFH